jgi:hypothetical protein
MDTLTFGAPRLVRRMCVCFVSHETTFTNCILVFCRWAAEAAKLPVLEFSLPKVLAGLELTQDQFVDVCILAGCDYCEPIKGKHCRAANQMFCTTVGCRNCLQHSLQADQDTWQHCGRHCIPG